MKSLCLNHLLTSAMNNIQIRQILSRIPTHAVGVFVADQIPLVWTRLKAFIFNTQRHNKPGLHWVAIFVNKNGTSKECEKILIEFSTTTKWNFRYMWLVLCHVFTLHVSGSWNWTFSRKFFF